MFLLKRPNAAMAMPVAGPPPPPLLSVFLPPPPPPPAVFCHNPSNVTASRCTRNSLGGAEWVTWSVTAGMFHRKEPEKAILVLNETIFGLGKRQWYLLKKEQRQRECVYRLNTYSGASLLRPMYNTKPCCIPVLCVGSLSSSFLISVQSTESKALSTSM